MVSLLSILGSASAYKGAAQTDSISRRSVIRQHLPGNPEKQITLVEVVFPPGAGSPPHLHANGVMGFVVSGSIASQVGDEPERVFHAGEAWWEPPGAVHRVSRNISSSEDARLLAIFVAPPNASESDLTKQL
jgi:quercetin dioxygenase-like cupin family protein